MIRCFSGSESHTKFGEQILRNLLVERAIASADPTDVTLGSAESRREFKMLARPSTRPLSKSLREAYLNSRRDRKRICNKNHLADLQQITMVAEGEKTLDRRR